MDKTFNWKKTIGGAILIFVIVLFVTMILIGNIVNLSTGLLGIVIAFASVITYLISKLL